MVLMRTDPFRDLDRWTQQVLGTAARPAVMPMDAWRDGDQFVVEFDLPGVNADSLDLDVGAMCSPSVPNDPTWTRTARWYRPSAPRCVQPAAVPRGQPRHRQDRGELSRRRAAADHPGGREGQAAADRDQPQPQDGDQRLRAGSQPRCSSAAVATRSFQLVGDDKEVMRRQPKLTR